MEKIASYILSGINVLDSIANSLKIIANAVEEIRVCQKIQTR